MRLLALISFAVALLPAATRPYYGGTLRVQIADALPSLEPGDPGRDRIAVLIAETLVELDDRGVAQPKLALSWRHDAEAKRWWFTLRPRVVFHDGSAFTAAAGAGLLSGLMKNISVSAVGNTLVFESPVSRPALLEELANPRYSVFKRSAEIPVIGTGPFRLNPWLPGAPVMLTAFEDHWAGRPYVDAIHFDTKHSAVPDVVELPANASPRSLTERLHLEASAPVELFALVGPPAMREVFSLAMDRGSIVNVLLQKHGEPTAALLPNWLSGYAFLFDKNADLNRARQLATAFKQPITLSYPASDSLARGIAGRVALNARDAGLTVQVIPGQGQVRLVRLPIVSTDPAQALAEMAASLGSDDLIGAPYESEKALIDAAGIVPIAHVPRLFGIHTRVRDWESSKTVRWRLENVWIAP